LSGRARSIEICCVLRDGGEHGRAGAQALAASEDLQPRG
jgi:hypothetical protein